MFEELMHSIWEEFSKLIFHAEVEFSPAEVDAAFGGDRGQPAELDYSGGTLEAQPSALQQVTATAAAEAGIAQAAPGGGNGAPAPGVVETVVKGEREKIGRNDPCWCGSGKKYKKCHGA
jgi:preprotein translocase subunit SecA